MSNRYARSIKKNRVSQAVYIDFEGRATDEPPSMLGVLYECDGTDQFTQFTFDPPLQIASSATGVDGSGEDASLAADLEDTLDWLVSFAIREDRTIVSWSKHDDEVIREFAPGLSGYPYRNAIASAKKWAGLKDLSRPEGNRLQWYLQELGYEVPEEVREGAGTWIKTAQDRIRTHGQWAPVSQKGKAAWRNLVEHNRHDLYGMRYVVEVAKYLRNPN